MMMKNTLSLLLAVTCYSTMVSAQLRARKLSDGKPDAECGSYKQCSLVNLETNAEFVMTEGAVLNYNPAEGNRWSIRCDVTGKIDFVKFFQNGVKVSDQYSTPAWWRGDNHGTWVNHDDNLKVCGKKIVRVSFHTWRTMDKYPCSVKIFEIEPIGCVAPTKAPTAAPTQYPTRSPTRSPTKSPTRSPTTSPTKSPTASPTPSPTKTPFKATVQAPTEEPTKSPVCSVEKLPKPPSCTLKGNELCYGYAAEHGWTVEAHFSANDATFLEMPVTTDGAKCLTVNSNTFQQKNFWLRFANGCGGSDWTWCINSAVYNPSNPAPTKAPTRIILVPQTASPAAPSVCPLPPVSPQCYLWASKLNYGLDLPTGTDIEVVTSTGQKLTWPAEPGQTYRDVTQLDFVRKNFKLRFRNECGVSEYKFCKNYTPIGLDIDHSGDVEHITGTFHIDINGDGEINELKEWFAPTEGILISMNHGVVDGLITGHHLFGDQGGVYTDGFHKLGEQHDDNGDQYVRGYELAGLAIWNDANSNAKLDDGELSTLADHKIVELSIQHQTFVSKAILEDRSSIMMKDLWFER